MKVCNKILIIGCCGSGKSTLANEIYSKTKLPLIHLDKIYYKPKWEKTPRYEWETKVANLCKSDKWIIDGNYINTLELRATAADMIIFLDISRWKCLYRAILRVIIPSKRNRPDMANDCTERFDLQFYRYILNFHKTAKPRIAKVLESNSHKAIHVLRNTVEIKQFINDL